MPSNFELSPHRRRLGPWQASAFAYCMQAKHPALCMEMRLGKTLVAIRRASMYRPRSSEGLRILVVAPSTVLGNWEAELAMEGITDVAWLLGPRNVREELLGQWDATWWLMNKEGHLSLGNIVGEMPWDAVILDEHFIKNPKAQVTKHFVNLYRGVPHRWWLTGTPMPESELDIVSPMLYLDGTYMGYRNYWNFRAKNYTQYGYDWVPQPAARQRQLTQLAERAYVLRRADVGMDVPKVYHVRSFTLPPKIQRIYNTMEDDYLIEVNGQVKAKTKWKGEQFSWLRQLCGGHLEGEQVWDGPIRELVYLMQTEQRGAQVVVWAAFTAELEACAKVLQAAGITHKVLTGAVKIGPARQVIVNEFNAGKVQVLLCQPELVKYGLDLSAAHTAIYYSSPLGTETRQQSEDRIVNVWQKNTVLLIDFVVKGTVSEDMYTMVRGKKEAAQGTTYLVKQMQARKEAA